MTQIPRETLAECLDLLDQGFSIDEILSRFPEQSAALRPFLETTVRLSRLAHAPTLAARRQSREAVLREVDALGGRRAPGAPLWMRLRQALVPALSFAVLLLLFVVALPRVSATALPGDSLYPGKRLVERTELLLASNPQQRATLRARFNEERIREVEALLDSRRRAEVQYEGGIGQIAPDHWTVAGIRVNLSPETAVEGEPWLSARTVVQGRTQDGRLLATRLVVFGQPPPPAPETTPAATTPAATPSPTPTATEIVNPTPTATLQPALTPPSPPPPSPTSDGGGDDGNENDDNGNENDDGNENDNNDNGDDNTNDNGDDDDDNTNDNGDDDDDDDNSNEGSDD